MDQRSDNVIFEDTFDEVVLKDSFKQVIFTDAFDQVVFDLRDLDLIGEYNDDYENSYA